MRCIPDDSFGWKSFIDEKIPLWMINLLRLNPGYPHWGPHEDYMIKEDRGWETPQFFNSWKEFGPWELDDLNEIVNFYFDIYRPAKACPDCELGYNEETQKLYNDFYGIPSYRGGWRTHLTQDETNLIVKRRHLEPCSAEEMNKRAAESGLCFDAIDAHSLIEFRAKKMGVYGLCSTCKGTHSVYTSDECILILVLWVLHPRKGCSRGLEIKNITEEDLPEVFKLLRDAATRNANRFKGVCKVKNVSQLKNSIKTQDQKIYDLFKSKTTFTKEEKTLLESLGVTIYDDMEDEDK